LKVTPAENNMGKLTEEEKSYSLIPPSLNNNPKPLYMKKQNKPL